MHGGVCHLLCFVYVGCVSEGVAAALIVTALACCSCHFSSGSGKARTSVTEYRRCGFTVEALPCYFVAYHYRQLTLAAPMTDTVPTKLSQFPPMSLSVPKSGDYTAVKLSKHGGLTSAAGNHYNYGLLGTGRGHSSGAVWESRWTSWAVRPNEPSGFRGRKDLLHRASALVTTCP